MNDKYRILHLEDVPADAELAGRELKESKMDFDHLVIDSEAEYVKALREFSPDVILCDHSLPSFDSFEALRIMKEKKLNIPFILITATLTEEVAMSVVREGADDYILKDRLKRLPHAVINAIEKFRFEKELKKKIDEAYEKEALSKELLSRLSNKVLLATQVAGIGIWEYLFDQQKFLADGVLLQQYGLTTADFNDHYEELIRYIHPEDRGRVKQEFRNAITTHSGLDTEYQIIWPDRSIHFIKTFAVVQRDHLGNPSRLIGTSQDVTEYKKTEDKIKASELRYRSLIEEATDAICIADSSMKFYDMNSSGCKMLGYSKEEFLLLSVADLFLTEDLTANPFKMDDLNSGKTIRNERRLKRKDGTLVDVEVSGKLLEDGRFIMFGRDITERKKAEEVIEESNQRYNYVTKATFDAIWDWDLLSKTIYWGEGFQTLFGYNLQEVKPDISSWTDHIHPDDIDRVIKGIHQFIEGTRTNWVDEYRYLKTDQTYAYVTDKGFVIRDEQGKGIRMVGAMQDITGEKELENLLNKTNHMARIGSWEVDLVKGTVYWSDIAKEIHETEQDFIPDLQSVTKFYKEGKSRDLITQKVQEATKKGIPWDVELQIITARGNEKWIRSIGEAEFVNGKCIRFNGSFQDIDARKRAELAIIEVLEEKNTILESIDDAFFAVDKNWTVTYWNKQAEKVLGKAKNEILDHNLWEVYSDNIDSESYKKYHQAIETTQSVHFDDYYPALAKWYEISAYPSKSGLSVYFKDVTERKLSEIRMTELNQNLQKQTKELAVSNSELEQFAYVASHDLQEPLRMITSFLTLLEKKYANVIDDQGKMYVDFAVDGAKRMRQIILDLLEFSRVGRTEDSKEKLDLNELVKEIQILFRKQVEEKSATIGVGELPVIQAHKAPLRQVFQNLISNALKYSHKDLPAQIHITANECKNHWQFSVTDNGIGISGEYFDKIFIIFQRLHNKDEFSGTGMGLAVTKKIVESLGGKIWVESTEGKGSTFYFTLLKNN